MFPLMLKNMFIKKYCKKKEWQFYPVVLQFLSLATLSGQSPTLPLWTCMKYKHQENLNFRFAARMKIITLRLSAVIVPAARGSPPQLLLFLLRADLFVTVTSFFFRFGPTSSTGTSLSDFADLVPGSCWSSFFLAAFERPLVTLTGRFKRDEAQYLLFSVSVCSAKTCIYLKHKTLKPQRS